MVWTSSMELTWASLMWVMTSPSWSPQAWAGEASPWSVVMSDNPTTRTPWAKSLMPTARPRGITERGALFWDSAAWAPGTSATVITTAVASRSRVRKNHTATPDPWRSLVSCKKSPPSFSKHSCQQWFALRSAGRSAHTGAGRSAGVPEGRAAGKTGGAGVFLRQDRKKKMVDRKREKTRKLTMACFLKKRSGKVTQCFLGRDCLLFQRAFVKMKKDRKDRERR